MQEQACGLEGLSVLSLWLVGFVSATLSEKPCQTHLGSETSTVMTGGLCLLKIHSWWGGGQSLKPFGDSRDPQGFVKFYVETNTARAK